MANVKSKTKVKKVKFKSKRSLEKRFRGKITPNGKVKVIKRAHTSHLAYSKTNKQRKNLHKSSLLDKSDFKRLRRLLQS